MERAFFTTSWDDGHPLDLRMAERLVSHGLLGTFYVPVSYRRFPGLLKNEIKELAGMGMEIGSHTLSHARLTELPDSTLIGEVAGGKAYLEDILGRPVTAFCHPEGKFNKRTNCAVIRAGFSVSRTTVAFQVTPEFDPIQMPVSFQFFPHSRGVHLRHALNQGNLSGLKNWARLWRMETNLTRLCALILEHVLNHGGVLHIWGHSWEIDHCGLWSELEQIFELVEGCGGMGRCTNTGLLTRHGVGA